MNEEVDVSYRVSNTQEDLIERINSDGSITLGYYKEGVFQQIGEDYELDI